MFEHEGYGYYLEGGRGFRVPIGDESATPTEIFQVKLTASPATGAAWLSSKDPTRVWMLQGPSEAECLEFEGTGRYTDVIFKTGALDDADKDYRWSQTICRPAPAPKSLSSRLTRTLTWTFALADFTQGGIVLTYRRGRPIKARII